MVSGPGTLLNQCRLHKTKKHYSDCLTIKITLTPQASARCERKVFLLCDRSFKSSSSSALPQRRRRLGIVVQIVVFITYTETRCKWWRLGAPIRTLAPRTLTRQVANKGHHTVTYSPLPSSLVTTYLANMPQFADYLMTWTSCLLR